MKIEKCVVCGEEMGVYDDCFESEDGNHISESEQKRFRRNLLRKSRREKSQREKSLGSVA